MFAVMKNFDVMIGIDYHLCWPPGAPKPLDAPQPYLTIMLLNGIQPLTPMMAKTCMTLYGMTMQRGTDIGPGIPHIGAPSKLTPLDILGSSSVSYFGPSAYSAEGQPVAAALAVLININLNCWKEGPMPSGIVLCPTTHFTGMTLMDIVFGVVSFAVDQVFDAVIGAAADKFASVVQTVAAPITKKLSTKLAAKTAGQVSASTATTAAGKTAGKTAAPKLGGHRPGFTPGKTPAGAAPSGGPQLGGHRPSSTPGPTPTGAPPSGGPKIGGHRPSFTPGKTPAGAPPPGGPQLGGHRPSFTPGKTPTGAPPSGGPNLGSHRPAASQPNKPPPDVWRPGKPSAQQRPQNRPTLGQHRPPAPEQVPTMGQLYKEAGYDALLGMLLAAPLSIPYQMTYDMLALTGIEEFGAPREPQQGGA